MKWLTATILLGVLSPLWAHEDVISDHPRPSYDNVEDIDAMASALRLHLASQERYSFSRSWWQWDRLRHRFVDGGRKNLKELKILQAVFRALILDWHTKLTERGEGDRLYLFFTTVSGNKTARTLADGRTLTRDLHGGGYHGGWGGTARMRIYEELVRMHMLTEDEQQQMRTIVHQSMSPRFLNFRQGAQSANNHSYGNAGGIAMALKLFPNVPQRNEADAWLDRIWASLKELNDWREWTYYPYGPIFLHGVLDVAEARGVVDRERKLLETLGDRCLGFVHAGGVRGNPNSGAPVRANIQEVYADPWNVGYYQVETSGRDAHFWYRLAQMTGRADYLWAAEQVCLGGTDFGGQGSVVDISRANARQRRFGWFDRQGIQPEAPQSTSSIGYLGAATQRIPERLMLTSNRGGNVPFAGYFLYEKKDAHLDNVSGHLYEYSFNGFKFLHSSGKYNNVYSGNDLKGGGTGEESLDLLLTVHQRHHFPLHPDRQGDDRDFLRRDNIHLNRDQLKAETDKEGNCFGQFSWRGVGGPGSVWVRRSVLTANGIMVVADEFTAGPELKENYNTGPVWHLAWHPPPDSAPEPATSENEIAPQDHRWFSAAAFDRAWWQRGKGRILLQISSDQLLKYGSVRQKHSQDTQPNLTVFGNRAVKAGRTERFLSIFVPWFDQRPEQEIAATVVSHVTSTGTFTATVGRTTVRLTKDDWTVTTSR